MTNKIWMVLAAVVILATAVAWVMLKPKQATEAGAEPPAKPAQYGQYPAADIPQTAADTYQSIPASNFHVSMRRGRCNTMYQHLQTMKKAHLDSEDYLHAHQAIRLLAREMINDFVAEPGLRNDSMANAQVWSDAAGFAQSREDLLMTMVGQMQQREQNQSVGKQEEVRQIVDRCQACHSKYMLNHGQSLKIS